jgi:mitogen-activated protein kinase 1/3
MLIRVAVKIIEDCFTTTTDARRTLREISILRQSTHPNIGKIVTVLQPPDPRTFRELWIVQEYGGWDLRRILKNSNYIDGWGEMHVKYIVYQIMCGLLYLKSANIVHRDIKPSNILMDEKCNLSIIDFGLARQINEQRKASIDTIETFASNSKLSHIVQTPPLKRQLTHHVVTRWYRAPELILLQDSYNSAIDMWSVGCILGELLTTLEPGGKSKPLFPGTTCYPLSKDGNDFEPDTVRRELSNEHHQLNQIFKLTGTPSQEEIDAIENVQFKQYLHKLVKSESVPFESRWKNAAPHALELLRKMLRFDPNSRITVEEALESPYFTEVRRKEKEIVASNVMSFPWEDLPRLSRDAEKERLRHLILHEISLFDELKLKDGSQISQRPQVETSLKSQENVLRGSNQLSSASTSDSRVYRSKSSYIKSPINRVPEGKRKRGSCIIS